MARERKLDSGALRTLIDHQAQGSVLGFLGEPRVNVLSLNRQLDAMSATTPK